MEAQFGEWRFDSLRSPGHATEADNVCAQFGFGRDGSYRGAGIEIYCLSFPCTEPACSGQPRKLSSGDVLVWGGRLDNAPDLTRELGISEGSCDSEVVSHAWLQWQEKALRRLLGDWSLSVWNPHNRLLLLATDFLGSHHLYYAQERDHVRWCSSLEPLVSLAGDGLSIEQEYIAGWIAGFPRADLTPFQQIRRVAPASTVYITERRCVIRRYWDFDGSRTTRHRLDADYEAEFLHHFGRSVNRRLRSVWPVMAELSGGLDSSSIVCMADRITSAAGRPPIDTVSYYNNTESNWNEQIWFSKVEDARGRTGLHIDVSLPASLEGSAEDHGCIRCWPGASRTPQKNTLLEHMVQGGHRVLLSGLGGDEFLGGVPTPIPELENLLSRGQILRLIARLLEWSLTQRRPLIHLLRDTAAGFLPLTAARSLRPTPLPAWINPQFVRRHRLALAGYPRRWHLVGPLPSFQENLGALETIRRQLGCTELTSGHPFEKRYPLLDRDLLEFLFSVPREQLVRPGQRRSLMRRALRGIVPEEILGRRRKAYVTKAPLLIAESQYDKWSHAGMPMISETCGYTESGAFLYALQAARQGRNMAIIPLLRTIVLEEWLGELASGGWLKQDALGGGDQPRFRIGERLPD